MRPPASWPGVSSRSHINFPRNPKNFLDQLHYARAWATRSRSLELGNAGPT